MRKKIYISGIYCLTNKTKNIYYIGKCKNFKTRLNTHLCELRKGNHCNKKMQQDFSNGDKFTYKILVKCPPVNDLLYYEERRLINEYINKGNQLYNAPHTIYPPKFATREMAINRFLDAYCIEHFDMTFSQLANLNRSDAKYSMMVEIVENPEKAKEIIDNYHDVTIYLNKLKKAV